MYQNRSESSAMLRYLQASIDRLRWQRLPAFQKLAAMLLEHLDGILHHSRRPIRFGVVEAINGNIKALLRRGRGSTDLCYLLLKAQRQPTTKTEFIVKKPEGPKPEGPSRI
jgi:transposase